MKTNLSRKEGEPLSLFKLPDNVFSIQGNASKFLNGITSNTLEAPLNAFLNQHGRIIATFRQQKISDDEFLISVPSIAAGSLLKHLERYAKLSHTKIEESPQLAYLDMDTSKMVFAATKESNSMSDDVVTFFRLDHQIPLMGMDYKADEFILNVHEHDYVSYTKGCFLGQEPVAKVHNRSKPTRKLIVAFEDQCSPEEASTMTSKIKDLQTGRTKGFVFISNK